MTDAKIALTHAGGLLAEALLSELAESGVKPDSLVLLDVPDQAGGRMAYGGGYLKVLDQYAYDFEDVAAIFLLQADHELEDLLQHADCVVVSHHQRTPVEAEHYFDASAAHSLRESAGPVRLPSAALATLTSVLQPLHERYLINTVNAVIIKSASMFGQAAVEELATQTISLLNSRETAAAIFPMQLAFNLLPEAVVGDQAEILRQYLGSGSIQCSVQSLVAAAFHGLAISVQLTVADVVDIDRVAQTLAALPGVRVESEMVSPFSHCQSGMEILLCGLFQPQKDAKQLQFWIIADGIRNPLVKNYQKVTDLLLNSVS